MAVQREKAIQAQGVSLLRSVGGAVYVLGTHRRRGDYQGTMQTPGVSDVICFLPPARYDTSPLNGSRVLFYECKAPKGRLSPDQQAFRLYCELAHVAYVSGDLDALIRWLCEHGYCRVDSFPHYRQPKAVSA